MTVWADPPLSRREARQKVREESGADTVTVTDEELAAAVAAEEAARYGGDPAVRSTSSGGRRAQWSPPPLTSSFAPVHSTDSAEVEDNTAESQAEVMPELTMTRRELRALRERAAAGDQSNPAIVFLPTGMNGEVPPVDSAEEQAEAVEPDAAETDAVEPDPAETDAAEPDAAEPEAIEPEAVEREIAVDVTSSADPIPELIEPSSADWTFRASRPSTVTGPAEEQTHPEPTDPPEPASPTEIASDTAGPSTSDHDVEYIEAELVEESHGEATPQPGENSPPQPEAADVTTAAPETLSPFDALFRPQTSDGPATATAVEPGAKPYGHWTTQAALDDAAPSVGGFLSRDVGVTTGAITTHALVLPSIPESGDQLLAPLTNTGEIMITGSIDLPRTFGSTGAHPPRFDHPDVDALIEESDREDAVSTSAPVRAVRAVSSTTSTRGVIEAPAKPKSRLPLIGGIVLGGLILVAGAFVAAALIFNRL